MNDANMKKLIVIFSQYAINVSSILLKQFKFEYMIERIG